MFLVVYCLLQLPTSTSQFNFLVRYSLLLIHFPSSLDFGRTMFRRNEGLENTGIGNWAKQQWTRAKSESTPLVRRRATYYIQVRRLERTVEIQDFDFHYPGVSEEQRFTETSDWRTQGSGIGEAAMDEGKTGDLPRSSGDEQHIAFKSGDLNERNVFF